MIDAGRQTCRVFLYGSCVCRDVFERLDPSRFELTDFVARSSIGSSFSGEWDLGDSLQLIESPFWRRMVDVGARAQVMALLLKSDYDVLVLDFVEERLPIMMSGGRALTVGVELLRSGIVEQVGQDAKFVRSGSKRHFELWCEGLACLAGILEQRPDVTPVLLTVKWAPVDNLERQYPAEDVAPGNQYLELLYAMAKQNLKRLVVLSDDGEACIADSCHRWGPAPFHYVEPYYQQFVRGISDLVVKREVEAGQCARTASRCGRLVHTEAV